MHQDYLRSAVYNSLVKPLPIPCDNGNESLQCETNRRPQIPLSTSTATIFPSKEAFFLIPNSSSSSVVEAMARRESSESQLQQVSEGARKLTRMINSLSKGPNLEGQSKFIAEDLMRGALDLQESLVMLARLQEASKLMDERKRKPKVGLMGEREEGFGIEAMGSGRFDVRVLQAKLQEPRLSLDGSSKNSVELKKLIRDSLHRPSLLSNSYDDENCSSSRSLNFSSSCRFGDLSFERRRPASPINAKTQAKEVKSSNLIAKLMGLEEVPSETSKVIKREQEKKLYLTPPKPSFDIEMCKPTKLQHTDQTLDLKQKTLDEIIETMQFKGILKNDQVEGRRIQAQDSRTSQSERYGTNFFIKDVEAPPIVIMKPLHLPHWERGEVLKDLRLGKTSLPEEIKSVKSIQESKASDHKRMQPKKLERKEAKRTEKIAAESFPETDYRKHASETCKKVDEGQKPLIKGKKSREKRETKEARAPSISHDKAASEVAKPSRRPSAVKNYVPQGRSLNRPLSPNSTSPSKRNKTLGAKTAIQSTGIKAIENAKFEDCKGSSSHNSHTVDLSHSTTVPADNLSKGSEQGLISCGQDVIVEKPKALILTEISSEFTQETTLPPASPHTNPRSEGLKGQIMLLLSSNEAFLSLANEFLGLDSDQRTHLHRRETLDETVKRDASLFLDSAKELLARERRKLELSSHPVSRAYMSCDRTATVSIGQLVNLISAGIEKITGYAMVDKGATSEESLYGRLDRDLRCKEVMLDVIWDDGWRSWVCVEEAEQAVSEIENGILSVLVEEILVDFVHQRL